MHTVAQLPLLSSSDFFSHFRICTAISLVTVAWMFKPGFSGMTVDGGNSRMCGNWIHCSTACWLTRHVTELLGTIKSDLEPQLQRKGHFRGLNLNILSTSIFIASWWSTYIAIFTASTSPYILSTPFLLAMLWRIPCRLCFGLRMLPLLQPSQRVMNKRQCLNVNNLRLPHPSRLSAFFTTFPGLYLWKKPYHQKMLVLIKSSSFPFLDTFGSLWRSHRRWRMYFTFFLSFHTMWWM